MDVKDNYTNIFLKAAELDITAELVKSKRMDWWWNVRVKNDGGLRLTDQAMDFIKNESEIKIYNSTFEFEIPYSKT